MRHYTRLTSPVKATRHTPRTPRPFGEGLGERCPHYRLPITAADMEWAAQAFGEQADACTPDELAEMEAQAQALQMQYEAMTEFWDTGERCGLCGLRESDGFTIDPSSGLCNSCLDSAFAVQERREMGSGYGMRQPTTWAGR